MLKQLVLKGTIVILDAMVCQEKIVANIGKQGAGYAIRLKGNQSVLREIVEDSFALFE